MTCSGECRRERGTASIGGQRRELVRVRWEAEGTRLVEERAVQEGRQLRPHVLHLAAEDPGSHRADPGRLGERVDQRAGAVVRCRSRSGPRKALSGRAVGSAGTACPGAGCLPPRHRSCLRRPADAAPRRAPVYSPSRRTRRGPDTCGAVEGCDRETLDGPWRATEDGSDPGSPTRTRPMPRRSVAIAIRGRGPEAGISLRDLDLSSQASLPAAGAADRAAGSRTSSRAHHRGDRGTRTALGYAPRIIRVAPRSTAPNPDLRARPRARSACSEAAAVSPDIMSVPARATSARASRKR